MRSRHPKIARSAYRVLRVVCLIPGLLSVDARAASDVLVATLAIGRLYVLGTTEKANTPVALENRFHTISSESGKYAFEVVYHPAACMISLEIEAKTYRAVVSNCGQQLQIGALPFATVEFPDLSRMVGTPPHRPAPARSIQIKPWVPPAPKRAEIRKLPRPRIDTPASALPED